MIGSTLSHYEISGSLGAGGMGEVYLARDTNLDRVVALKILPRELAGDRDRLRRFVLEAKAASAVSHSNVAHIYEIGEAAGVHFIAMEYVEGDTLAARLKAGPLPPAEVARVGHEIAAALEDAHAHRIIHRDLKPANIMLTPRGQVKLLDFGLAKRASPFGEDMGDLVAVTRSLTQTEIGAVMGTLPYMSPEQLRGGWVDHRTDFFSLGVILYQMLTGERPFQGNTAIAVADAILHQECPPVRQINRSVPPDLAQVVAKLTAKDPAERYQSARDVVVALRPFQAGSSPGTWVRSLRRWPLAASAIVALAGLLSFAAWSSYRSAKVRWARDQALPQALDLADQAKYPEAFALAVQSERYIPGDPILARLWPKISRTLSIRSEPAGADVWINSYRGTDAGWQHAGRTPIASLRIARDIFRVRLSKPGFDTALRVAPTAWFPDRVDLIVPLVAEADVPRGLVRIPGGIDSGIVEPRAVGDFWIDRHEVTNREFKRFVDAGGYEKREYWKIPFVRDERELSWAQALQGFRDTTGRPGPAGWELGHYPEGEDDLPVTGVSWYEAAAYAEFAGKTLPTVHHWRYAAGLGIGFEIVPLSNFSGRKPHPIGTDRSLSPYGTFDMAGNVKEWCWNETLRGERYIVGGAYGDPEYLFSEAERRPPFQRERTFGFRCAKYIEQPDASLLEPFDRKWRDFRRETPIPDNVFALVKSLYAYEKTDPQAQIVSRHTTDPDWKKESVTIDAAYGDERVILHLFLPTASAPPYQTVVFFPGAWARMNRSSENIEQNIDFANYLDFVLKSGRAAVFPVYKGTFERGGGPVQGKMTSGDLQDWTLQYIKDLRRTLDYLESRSDIDREKLGFYGYSWGARIGAIVGGVEERFRVLILAHGGLPAEPQPPAVDELNFLPRVKVPVVMINGRYDHVFPVELSQKPFFERLGTPPGDKTYLLLAGGHSSPRNELIQAVLAGLDRYLGPVQRR
jgi:eukaryotic-like serine/threonine-protein kinase